MNWPWVSRRTHEDLIHDHRDLYNQLRELNARLAEAQRHAAQSLALLVARQAEPKPAALPPPPAVLAPPQKDEIAEAIELASGVDRSLARHLSKWAAQQKLDGMKPHDIIQSILHWHTADEWDGDPKSTPSVFGD